MSALRRRSISTGVGSSQRIDAGVQLHRFAVAQPLARSNVRAARQHRADQTLDVRHERVMVESEPIPFDQRELRVVLAAAFAVAINAADLPHVAAACGEQAFHRVLGRGVQEACLPVRGRGDAREMDVGHRGALSVGVSTSSARVAVKYSRAARSIEARSSSVAIEAVGRQSLHRARPMRASELQHRLRDAAQRPTRSCRFWNSSTTVEPMLKRPSSSPFAKLRPTPFGDPARALARARRRIHLAAMNGLDAADEQCADEDHRHPAVRRYRNRR